MFAGVGICPFPEPGVYYSLWQLIQLTRLLEELKIVLQITITTGNLETGVYEYVHYFPNATWGRRKRIVL